MDVAPRLSPRASAMLLGHRWPGNIRQLRNSLRAALAMCDGSEIDVEHLPAELLPTTLPMLPPQRLCSIGGDGSPNRGELAESPDAVALLEALRAQSWNISATANSLGLSRSTIYRRISRHRIVEPNRRS